MLHIYVAVLLNAIVIANGILGPSNINASHCKLHASERVSQYMPYVETYRTRKWGIFQQIQTRINYRIAYTTNWKITVVCCEGYRRKAQGCEPICSEFCINGQCVAPETCECDPGYVARDKPAFSNVCVPVCESNCANGFCIKPNQCACNTGYQVSEDELSCQPICSQYCDHLHAYCAKPDTCVCNPGYQQNNFITEDPLCTPICEVPCVNGKCTAPDVCTCNDGYEATDAFTCNPICEPECRFGKCTAPNTCACDPQYAMNEENTCVPICSEPCVMGTCIAPEVCRCNDGYGLLNSSTYVCEPICEKACVNGVCTGPGICTCNEGYWFSGSEEEERVCKPVCRVPCYPYGDCILPDICSCFEGYQVNTSVKILGNSGESMNLEPQGSACVPVCNEDCVNGKCTEPNVCRCNPGYYPSPNNSNICEPVCETPCGSNSVCAEPNSCTCLPGYKLTENEVQNVCEPNCEVPCGPNSTCVDPNVCACDKGYEQDDEDRCKPSCSSCYNGTCVAPDDCQCLDGFILTNDTVCLPFCNNSCENGECVAPNVCQCHDGFENKGNDSGCIRSCKKVCKGHGVCVEDEKPCECSYGWTGLNCDEPTVCISLMNSDDEILVGLAIYNETNSTLTDARHNAPYCYQCNETIGNTSFCFAMAPGNVSSMIGCFVETESPCYSMYHDKKATTSTMAGVLLVATISIIAIMAALATVTYFVVRRQQRRKVDAGTRCRKDTHGKIQRKTGTIIAQSALFQGSIANESLLSEEDAPLR